MCPAAEPNYNSTYREHKTFHTEYFHFEHVTRCLLPMQAEACGQTPDSEKKESGRREGKPSMPFLQTFHKRDSLTPWHH